MVLLGILQGILLAALASILMLLARVSRPHVAFLGRIPGTNNYSDLARHPDNEALPGVVAFRPEASLIYVNADAVPETVLSRLNAEGSGVRLVVCDLSASPYVDLAGARMLSVLHAELASAAPRCVSWARVAGYVTSCAPRASARRSAGLTGSRRSTACSARGRLPVPADLVGLVAARREPEVGSALDQR